MAGFVGASCVSCSMDMYWAVKVNTYGNKSSLLWQNM